MTPTPAMREPTKAEREMADAVYLAWCVRGGWDWRGLVAKALAAASAEMKERAAKALLRRFPNQIGEDAVAVIRTL